MLVSMAKLTGQKLTSGNPVDSKDHLDVLLGKSKNGRATMLEEAFTLSVRDGDWKYVAPQEKSTPDWLKNKKIENGLMSIPQLYNVKNDPGEKKNVAGQHPEIVKKLQKELADIKRD